MIPDINLLPKIEKGETSLRLAFMMVGILSFLTLGLFAWLFFSAKSEIADTEKTRGSLAAARDELQAEVSAYEMTNTGSLAESVAFVTRVSYPVSPLIIETQNLLPLNTYLRSYLFSETGVELVVDFETLNAVSAYVRDLKQSPYMLDVQVGTIENFEVDPAGEKQSTWQQFEEVPRYEAEINLLIDKASLAAGGDVQ